MQHVLLSCTVVWTVVPLWQALENMSSHGGYMTSSAAELSFGHQSACTAQHLVCQCLCSYPTALIWFRQGLPTLYHRHVLDTQRSPAGNPTVGGACHTRALIMYPTSELGQLTWSDSPLNMLSSSRCGEPAEKKQTMTSHHESFPSFSFRQAIISNGIYLSPEGKCRVYATVQGRFTLKTSSCYFQTYWWWGAPVSSWALLFSFPALPSTHLHLKFPPFFLRMRL